MPTRRCTFPDFRAAERTFQLVTQVAGRTGRGERGGRVVVQTYSPDHPAIVAAQRHDYVMFANQELPIRREFGYPPETALVRLVMRGPVEAVVETFGEQVAARLREAASARQMEPRILGPVAAPIPKLRGHFRFQILVYFPDATLLREAVQAATEQLKAPDEVLWMVDVDPLDML